jgi:hypothetical protein
MGNSVAFERPGRDAIKHGPPSWTRIEPAVSSRLPSFGISWRLTWFLHSGCGEAWLLGPRRADGSHRGQYNVLAQQAEGQAVEDAT